MVKAGIGESFGRAAKVRGLSPQLEMFYRLRRSPLSMIGGLIILVYALAAIFAPFIAPYDPAEQHWGDQLSPPSKKFLLGTDWYGRDILSRIIYGSRISLTIGVIAVGVGALIGIPLGAIAGYAGGRVDEAVMRLMDIMLAFPSIILAIAIAATLGQSLHNLMIAVGIVFIPGYARITRGTTLSIKEQDFVEAAKAIGLTDRGIIAKHILPNCIPTIVVLMTLDMAVAILYGAGLSFLGLGAQEPTAEWGSMLAQGRRFLPEAWWASTFPGLAIMFAILGFNLLGDGLRDALDPRLRGLV